MASGKITIICLKTTAPLVTKAGLLVPILQVLALTAGFRRWAPLGGQFSKAESASYRGCLLAEYGRSNDLPAVLALTPSAESAAPILAAVVFNPQFWPDMAVVNRRRPYFIAANTFVPNINLILIAEMIEPILDGFILLFAVTLP